MDRLGEGGQGERRIELGMGRLDREGGQDGIGRDRQARRAGRDMGKLRDG